MGEDPKKNNPNVYKLNKEMLEKWVATHKNKQPE